MKPSAVNTASTSASAGVGQMAIILTYEELEDEDRPRNSELCMYFSKKEGNTMDAH
jgi:hypothetical protein